VIALIASGVDVAASLLGAGTLDEAICEELGALVAVELLQRLSDQIVVLLNVEEDLLCDPSRATTCQYNVESNTPHDKLGHECCNGDEVRGLLLGGGATKLVKLAAEPLVDLLVHLVVLVAHLERSHTFLKGLGFGGRAVLVGAANEDGVVATETAVPVVHASRVRGCERGTGVGRN
jgi:hypothetical protein